MSLAKVFYNLEKNNSAIGHFNVSNLETFEMVVKAGRDSKVPIIVGVSEGAIKHAGIEFFLWAKQYFYNKYKSEFYLHLDHGRDLGILVDAIKGGFDSIMIDASHESFSENVFLTKKIVNIAHKHGVWVEAEMGRIGKSEEKGIDNTLELTDPLQAEDFARKTRCNSLAVSIGTLHGINKFSGKPHLHIDILKKIKHLVSVPLVLHGASNIDQKIVSSLKKQGVKIKKSQGLSEAVLKEAIKNGIRKVNFDTDINLAMLDNFMKTAKNGEVGFKFYKIMEDVAGKTGMDIMKKIKFISRR